jgi:hypothetical protein
MMRSMEDVAQLGLQPNVGARVSVPVDSAHASDLPKEVRYDLRTALWLRDAP